MVGPAFRAVSGDLRTWDPTTRRHDVRVDTSGRRSPPSAPAAAYWRTGVLAYWRTSRIRPTTSRSAAAPAPGPRRPGRRTAGTTRHAPSPAAARAAGRRGPLDLLRHEPPTCDYSALLHNLAAHGGQSTRPYPRNPGAGGNTGDRARLRLSDAATSRTGGWCACDPAAGRAARPGLRTPGGSEAAAGPFVPLLTDQEGAPRPWSASSSDGRVRRRGGGSTSPLARTVTRAAARHDSDVTGA